MLVLGLCLCGRVKLASSSTRRVVAAMLPLCYATKKSSSRRQALRVDAILATESWVASEEAVASAAGEEAMALARAAAKAASDAAYYAQAMVVENEEFPSEVDLMRLERARLSEMERAYRLDYDTEAALLEEEQSYVNHLEALLDNVSSLVREADVATEARLGSGKLEFTKCCHAFRTTWNPHITLMCPISLCSWEWVWNNFLKPYQVENQARMYMKVCTRLSCSKYGE